MYCYEMSNHLLKATKKLCEISEFPREISLTQLLAPVVWRGRAPDADPVAGGVELDGGAVEGGRHIEGVSPGQRPTQQLPELLLEARQPECLLVNFGRPNVKIRIFNVSRATVQVRTKKKLIINNI